MTITTEVTQEPLRPLQALAERRGLRRITVLAWRDAADTEAGGSEVHTAQVARLWAAAGIDVTVRTSKARGLPDVEVRDGYRVVRRSGRHMVFPSAVVEQLRGAHCHADGLVEVWNGVPFLSPVWCRCRKVTFIHHVHRDMWDMALSRSLATFGRVLEHRLAPPLYHWTRVLTPSHASKDEIVDYLGIPRERVTVVEPGVDPRFSPGAQESARPTILAVGRLVPYKRFEDLIGVMPEIVRRVPGARLVIIGDGYHRSQVEAAIRAFGVGDCVELRGRVGDADLVDAYRSAWVLASASIAEGWGMTITEAGACGTPAVVSDVGGHRDAVRVGESGLLAPSTRSLAAQLVRVLCDHQLRSRLASGALTAARDRSWSATASAMLEELTRI